MILPLLVKHVPEKSIEYCHEIWKSLRFKFKVTKKRETKLGDYRYYFQEKSHTITINGDLNKFSFLVTYLHEAAHMQTQLLYGENVKPHGQEWKDEFKKLLVHVMSEDVFPSDILIALNKYLRNPKASSCTDLNLLKALGKYDEKNHYKYLSEVHNGETFRFQKKYFIKESIIRTRALCKELKSGRRFYISEGAQVELMQAALF